MNVECHDLSTLPGTTALFRDYADMRSSAHAAALRRWYPSDPFTMDWAKSSPELEAAHRGRLADALLRQSDGFDASGAVLANIERLRNGAAAVVTGQQVALFGGPLLTLLKAATAIRKAQDATKASGRDHVPVFWLASEDHDLAEVDQVTLLSKTETETLRLGLRAERPVPVGGLRVDGGNEEGRLRLEAELDRASELLGWAPVCELLRACYAPNAHLAGAFGRLISKIFAAQGLIVMDASIREFHALGAPVLREAIAHAEEIEDALLKRSEELVSGGYHAQVLVARGHSLLFLLDAETGARLPLRRLGEGQWKAGSQSYSTEDLFAILENEPERLSPNALLRPVFQDRILPTAAYIGGPAEIAYFAQSAVVYEKILGRVTPVLPRLSATLIEPAIATAMATHEVSLAQMFEAKTVDALALRLGARAMPIEGKRKIAAVGNAMDIELTALTEYMSAMSADLARAAGVSASKMRYQMNRLRRMAAAFEVQKEASLKKHATAMMLNLFPDGHLQERLLGGVWFVARYGDALPELLVEHAGQECPGHRVIYL
ncbi:bacillithiol biosynthesis cysteine-adding enzyme BshC [Granulicella mallensis]|uniref:Putative cysteine ligase BshC n=1 Tax=Granulicella mallensis TaxID=940614 RepID=A0A7W8E953_9BACT|nr:bacillithiol biosynthesis cysteine-adding enzyme BshC [Granulicella mallensis]MBB5064128.1 bacillithiol biosynthesis cysteine-adding enzyme BshC [Granulicella mallensis]